MLDLDARIGLHEDDRAVLAEEELTGRSADVADMGEQAGRGFGDDALLLGAEERSGCLLDDLLVATLQSAVTRGHDPHISMGIGQALSLDVTGAHDLLLDEALTATEGTLRLPGGRGICGFEVLGCSAGTETASASAVDGLDDDGEPDPFGHLCGFGQIGHRAVGTGATGASTASATARAPDLSPRSSIAAGEDRPDQSGVDDGCANSAFSAI